ncbi:MAG: hypothetical protein EOM20_13865, partial [Spartobacteria bacterium]|nr:hypothetical protein [Spartobacteria bacterium]
MGEDLRHCGLNRNPKERKMRKNTLIIVVLMMWAARAPGVENIPIDGYAAMVNDRVITVGDVLMQLQPVELQLRELYEGIELEKKLEEAYADARQNLIERALILEEFKKSGKENLMKINLAISVLTGILLGFIVNSESATVVRDSKPAAKIYHAPLSQDAQWPGTKGLAKLDIPEMDALALAMSIADLNYHIKEMSGAELEVVV